MGPAFLIVKIIFFIFFSVRLILSFFIDLTNSSFLDGGGSAYLFLWSGLDDLVSHGGTFGSVFTFGIPISWLRYITLTPFQVSARLPPLVR